jgi:hypothetical protein
MYCNVPNAQAWETFTVINLGNGKVALRSVDKYVSSEGGTMPITCNRTSVGVWEQFDYLTNTDGTVSLRGSNGMFTSAEDGTKPMICNRSQAGPWERFVTSL